MECRAQCSGFELQNTSERQNRELGRKFIKFSGFGCGHVSIGLSALELAAVQNDAYAAKKVM